MRKILILLVCLMLIPTSAFAKSEKPYETFKEIKNEAPEFGKKPWEKEITVDLKKHTLEVKKDCYDSQKKYEENKRKVQAEIKRKELEKKAEDSLVEMEVPEIDDYKTWMSYTSVTATGSPQYHLLNHENAYTDEENFRKIGDYYCVALGSFYSTNIGDRFRITFENGQSIKVILGDQKADRHTDSKHQYSSSGNILEFIMGSKIRSNQDTINTKYPTGVKKIEKYTNEEDVFREK